MDLMLLLFYRFIFNLILILVKIIHKYSLKGHIVLLDL